MEYQLESPKTITIRQPESIQISSIKIEKVLDDPVNKKIIVWVAGFHHPIELHTLCGENYDNPPWTNESLLQAVVDFVSNAY